MYKNFGYLGDFFIYINGKYYCLCTPSLWDWCILDSFQYLLTELLNILRWFLFGTGLNVSVAQVSLVWLIFFLNYSSITIIFTDFNLANLGLYFYFITTFLIFWIILMLFSDHCRWNIFGFFLPFRPNELRLGGSVRSIFPLFWHINIRGVTLLQIHDEIWLSILMIYLYKHVFFPALTTMPIKYSSIDLWFYALTSNQCEISAVLFSDGQIDT